MWVGRGHHDAHELTRLLALLTGRPEADRDAHERLKDVPSDRLERLLEAGIRDHPSSAAAMWEVVEREKRAVLRAVREREKRRREG